MGEAGRRRLATRFSTERMIVRIVAAYEGVACEVQVPGRGPRTSLVCHQNQRDHERGTLKFVRVSIAISRPIPG